MEPKKDTCMLDMNKLTQRIVKTVSTEDALKDVTPIQWSENILTGKDKVLLGAPK